MTGPICRNSTVASRGMSKFIIFPIEIDKGWIWP